MKEKITELVLHYNGELYNFCYKIIEESEDLEKDFEYICKNLLRTPEEKTIPINVYINKEERDLIWKIYEGKIEGILSEIVNKANYGLLKPECFYSELLDSLQKNFTEKKELAVAFERILRDSRIPFEYLGKSLMMEQNIYKEKVKKNKKSIDKILYALRIEYSQKTEQASVLLNIIDGIEEYDDKVVVFSQLIDAIQRVGIANVLKNTIVEGIEASDEK